jgi:hypothetical protein
LVLATAAVDRCGAAQSPSEITSLVRSTRMVAESLRRATTTASPTTTGAASRAVLRWNSVSRWPTWDVIAAAIDHHQPPRHRHLAGVGEKIFAALS